MPEPAVIAAARYTRGAQFGAVLIAAVWLIAFNLPAVVENWGHYRWPLAVGAGWVVYLAVCGWGAWRLVADRPGSAVGPALVAVVLLVDAVVLAACPKSLFFTAANWSWGTVGWVAVILLWTRPVRHLLLVLAANAGLGLAALAFGPISGDDVARYLMVIYGTAALQFGLAAGVRVLAGAASRTAEALTQQAATDAQQAAATAVHAARLRRYEEVRRTAGTVLEELASGRADPLDPLVQERAAVEAGRLRRLIAESEDVTDALLRELRACADLADRRGVRLDFAVVGTVPAVPVEIRRSLTAPLIPVLAAAKKAARITVTASDDDVAIGVLADGDQPPDLSVDHPETNLSWQIEEDTLWVESRWTLRSGSP